MRARAGAGIHVSCCPRSTAFKPCRSLRMTGAAVKPSTLVQSLLEAFAALYELGVSAEFCLAHIEDRLQVCAAVSDELVTCRRTCTTRALC